MDHRSRRRLRRIAFALLLPLTIAAAVLGAYVLIRVGPILVSRRTEEVIGLLLIYLSIVLLIDRELT